MDLVRSEHDPEQLLRVQPAPERILHCARCDAPVDGVQRYCLVCGAHQLHVEDPAARYMTALMSQRRSSRDTRRSSRATPTVSRALLIACVAVALLVGALAGRASTGGDATVSAGPRAHTPATALRSTTTPRQPATSARTIKRLQRLTGSSYVKSQQGLPNQVSVP